MKRKQAIEYMQAIHDSLPNAAMQLFARDVIRFIGDLDDELMLKTGECIDITDAAKRMADALRSINNDIGDEFIVEKYFGAVSDDVDNYAGGL